MPPLTQLLVPMLLSAVLVFLASSVIHMVLKYHNSEMKPFANEDEVRDVIRKGNPQPGQYVIPHCVDHKQMNDPAVQQKFQDGPIGFLVLRPPGVIKLGPFLGAWFFYTLLVSAVVGCLASTVLRAGADHRAVFHLIAGATFLAYAGQSPADSIWKGKPWSATRKEMFDGLVYAALTGGAFSWLWPQ